MTEPNYIYIKGKGWTTGPELACSDRDGNTVVLTETTRPKLGDRWLVCNYATNELLNSDGNFNIEAIYKHVSKFQFVSWTIWNTRHEQDPRPPNCRYLILTLL